MLWQLQTPKQWGRTRPALSARDVAHAEIAASGIREIGRAERRCEDVGKGTTSRATTPIRRSLLLARYGAVQIGATRITFPEA